VHAEEAVLIDHHAATFLPAVLQRAQAQVAILRDAARHGPENAHDPAFLTQ